MPYRALGLCTARLLFYFIIKGSTAIARTKTARAAAASTNTQTSPITPVIKLKLSFIVTDSFHRFLMRFFVIDFLYAKYSALTEFVNFTINSVF